MATRSASRGSELALPAPGRVTLAARVACLLPERAPEPPPDQGRVPILDAGACPPWRQS